MSTPQASTPTAASPVYARLPFFKRLRLAIRLHTFKILASIFLRVIHLPGIVDTSTLPTFTKSYPCRSNLKNRIFIPKSYKSGDAPLPLYIDIHGGGFALMSPSVDDKFCSTLCNDHKILVASIDYPKTPAHPYPAAVEAVIELVNAILKDEALPFDKSKVSIGGFSAGANLSFAATQDESLQGKVGGVVANYAPVDFSTPTEVQLASRPAGAGPDPLEHGAGMFKWGYVNPGQDLKDPMLSVTYAPRNKLPPKIYIIGCELDMLCRDAEIMAEKLASVGSGERTGSDAVWEKNGVKWEKVLGENHGS
jgi:acetyl esterase/lipase